MDIVQQIRWARRFGSPKLRRLGLLITCVPLVGTGFIALAIGMRRQMVVVAMFGLCSIALSKFRKQLAKENPTDYPLPAGVASFQVQRALPAWVSAVLVLAIIGSGVLLMGPISTEAKALGTDPLWCIPFVLVCLVSLFVGLIFAVLGERRSPLIILAASVAGFIASFGDWTKSHNLVFKQLGIFMFLGSVAVVLDLTGRGRNINS